MERPVDSVVVTSISQPNAVLHEIAKAAAAKSVSFIVVGDTKSPADFQLEDCSFFSIEEQKALAFRYASVCPDKSYARKNIGYLIAISEGANTIIETDDDNFPKEGFLAPRHEIVRGRVVESEGWLNAYSLFTEKRIWPRGYPLENLQSDRQLCTAGYEDVFCPIQQGLADENPDVDAIFRLLFPLPISFDDAPPVVLRAGQWCPFNSQNTVFFREVFPLLYLPATCSFRMTDIWRSFVAQRILWTCGWSVSFHKATVWQDRNEHDLIRDFADECSGYVNNRRIAEAFAKLDLSGGPEAICQNMLRCYEELLRLELVGSLELKLLSAWIADIEKLRSASKSANS